MKVRVHNGVEVTTLAINNNDLHMEGSRGSDESHLFLNQYEREQLLNALALETVAAPGMAVGSVEAEISQEEVNLEMET